MRCVLEKSGLIVAEDVVSDDTDNDMLVFVTDKVGRNPGERVEETVAAGYYLPEELVKDEERGLYLQVNRGESIHPKNDEETFHKSKIFLIIFENLLLKSLQFFVMNLVL